MEKKKVLLIAIIALGVVGILCLEIGIYKSLTNKQNIDSKTEFTDNAPDADESLVQENVIINTDGIKENVNENVISPVTIDEFVLKNISLKYEDNVTVFEATVVNNSDVDYNFGTMFNIYFYDNDGNVMVMVPTTTSSLPAKGESFISPSITMDCTNAASIKVELAK